jgi:hypothetical protein
MKRREMRVFVCVGLITLTVSGIHSQESTSRNADTLKAAQSMYDPFGPENSPDHSGSGSGGVVTPSPYDDVIQTNYTRISADYSGIQFMLDAPWQFAPGISWPSDESDIFGILFKVRSYSFRKLYYNPVLEDTVPYYRLPFELSIDYSLDDRDFRAFKFRLHFKTTPRSLGMAGIGVLVSHWNLMVARDRPLNRQWDIELTWVQVAGGYVMPLSPKVGGLNFSLSGAVDLFGAKHLRYRLERNNFYGTKIGSAGWLAGVGWNAVSLLNLSLYAGGEWSFSTGALELPTSQIVRADIGRSTLYIGVQITGRYLNLTGGAQKEWEYLDFQKTVKSEKGIRYYLGANYYLRR